MNPASTEMMIFNIATYCILGLFACFAFMSWYLRKNVESELKEKIRNAIWLECIFYFRDFTHKEFRRVHFVYQLAICLMVVITALFVAGIFFQVKNLQSPINYLVSCGVIVLVAVVTGMVYRLSKKRYYE